MNHFIRLLSAAILTLLPALAHADKAGCADHPLFPTRMPEYVLDDCRTEEHGIYEFWVRKGPKTAVEGKFTFLTYTYTGPKANEPLGERKYQQGQPRDLGTDRKGQRQNLATHRRETRNDAVY